MGYVLFGIGYFALSAYILYQAISLDTYRKENAKLRLEVQYLKPPF